MSTLTTRSLSQPKAFTGICINIQNFTPATNQCSWRKLHEKFKSKSSQITLEYFRSFLLVPFAESLGRVSPQVCPPWVMECNGIPCRESMEVLKVDPEHLAAFTLPEEAVDLSRPAWPVQFSPGFHQAFIMFLWEHLGAVRLWSMSQRVTTWNAETWNVRLLHDYRINYSEYFRVMSTCHHDVPCVKRIVGTEVFLRLSSGILERRLHSNVTFTEDEEGLAAEACANLCYVCFDSFVSLCYPNSFSIPRKSRKCMEMYQVNGKCWNCK